MATTLATIHVSTMNPETSSVRTAAGPGAAGGVARYEIVDPHHRHHHFVDERTGDVHPFTDTQLDVALRQTAERLGISLSCHEVILRGRQREGV